MVDKRDERSGTVELTPFPDAVVAGSTAQWTIVYTAGSYGIDEGGTLMLVQRFACDWQTPQFDKPDQPGYTTVSTTGKAKLAVRFQRKQHPRPWQSWCLIIDVHGGYLKPGDTITIVMGDTSQGSPGIRAQSFIESHHEIRVLVDPTNAAMVRRLPSSPVFPIISGKPTRMVCIVPSELIVGDSFEIFVKGEDLWGNPTPAPEDVSFSIEGDAKALIDGMHVKAEEPGTLRVRASISGQSCVSNPVKIVAQKPVYSRYWGDLHAQTDSTVGTGTEEEYFTFGRDIARLDFMSHQGNDFQVTDDDWKRLGATVKSFNKPGRFVVFPGYEWSGNTAAGGDHNVIYLKDNQPVFRSSHWQIPGVAEDENSPAHPIDQLHRRLHKCGDVLLIPHVGGRYADIRRYFDDDLTSVVEIVSCWGVFEWMLWDAVDSGHMVGVVCNSDGHKGRPGAEGPGAGEFGIYGGLTCVLAESFTRESIFKALKERRCYGTTGTRIYMWFEANGHPMGSYLETSEPVQIEAHAKGTGALEALFLYQGREVIQVVRPPEFNDIENSRRIRIRWEGALMRGRARRAIWNGRISATGTSIIDAHTFAFDSPADGIIAWNQEEVKFNSSTTGDVDGIDIFIDTVGSGTITFESSLAHCQVNLSELKSDIRRFDCGGLGLKVSIERYPERIRERELSLAYTLPLRENATVPCLIKVVQEDGHMAWTSPIYVKNIVQELMPG